MPFTFRAHKRHDVYRLWRDAVTIRRRLGETSPGMFQIDGERDPERRRRFCDGLVTLRSLENADRIDAGSLLIATADLVLLHCDGLMVPDSMFANTVRSVEPLLGRVAISRSGLKQYIFIEDSTPLDTEHWLLSAVLEMEDDIIGNAHHYVDDLAEAANVSEPEVRRILCRWMDDGTVYMHNDALYNGREPFLLENKARSRARLEGWARYAESRERTQRFTLFVRAERPFPSDAERLVHGIGRELGLRFAEVVEGGKGFTVEGSWPGEMAAEHRVTIQDALTKQVRETFAEVLRHTVTPPLVSIAHTNNFNNTGQAGAIGPGAVAVGNHLIQCVVSEGTEHLAEELTKLREHLLSRVSTTQDAIDLGAVAEAEQAAMRNDPSGLAAAFRRLAAGTLEVMGTLGLMRLKMWIADKLGIQTPPLLPPGGG